MKSDLRILVFATILFLPALSMPSAALADEDGRYRAIVLQEGGTSVGGGSLTPRVFLIDSQDGHMWILERNTPLSGRNALFGTILTYQGKLKPGSRVGEIIYQTESSP